MEKRVIILPLDGCKDSQELLGKAREILSDPLAGSLVSHIKINDGSDLPDMPGPKVVAALKSLFKELGVKIDVFLDKKWGDTKDTLKNYAKHYEQPDILTVSSLVSGKGFLELRRALPGTRIALLSALTDLSVEECQRRFGHSPDTKIYHDARTIQADYEKVREETDPETAFDLIVCSPLELGFLRRNFRYKYGYIVPGIRDTWMTKGQQVRTMGVKAALVGGANYVVMGAQMTKGNPDNNISAEESRRRTAEEINKADVVNIHPTNHLVTLKSCGGYYECPQGSEGRWMGPLVPYAGTYNVGGTRDGEKKQYVGRVYYNFAKIEERPRVLRYIGECLAEIAQKNFGDIDVIVGAPMGGIKISGAVAEALNCRGIFAEKKIIALDDPGNGLREQSEFIVKRHDINEGDKAIVMEDICNNFSSTAKIVSAIEKRGAKVVGIVCFLNRSSTEEWNSLRVASSLFIPTEQWEQEDSSVADDIANGNIVWDPKKNWALLEEAMQKGIEAT